MEWAPIGGALPPLSRAEWDRLFELYKQIPQYALLHPGMGLAGFQGLFWLEWTHRLAGRLVGIAFLVPLAWLWITGRIERGLRLRLAGLFLLGAAQGAVGWFMVASGFLPASTAVSQYRLVAHLVLALTLFVAILWTGMSVLRPAPVHLDWPGARATRCLATLLAVVVGLTMVAGGFTSGLHAGLAYNTFPLMDGELIPSGYAGLDPFWRNLAENVAAVQFNHRALAALAALTGLATVALGLSTGLPHRIAVMLVLLGEVLALQFALGVMTLLLHVPPVLAVAHQGVAVALLTVALAIVHVLRGARHQHIPVVLHREQPASEIATP
jgi:cytochrome c oxidase assembly protein subunit 15